jgi:hypothetical protein
MTSDEIKMKRDRYYDHDRVNDIYQKILSSSKPLPSIFLGFSGNGDVKDVNQIFFGNLQKNL